MNILMVSDNFFPEAIGGSGRVVSEIAKKLASKGNSVFVLTPKTQNTKNSTIDGIKVYHYLVCRNNSLAFFISTLVNSSKTFSQLTKQVKFDIVNFHQPLSALGIIFSRALKGIPSVYTFHSSWPQEFQIRTGKRGPGFFARRWIERKVVSKNRKILTLSEYSKKVILDFFGLNDLNIEVIPGGVDASIFKPAKDKELLCHQLGVSSEKFLLFSLRNLVPRMGLENLIEAMSILVKKFPEVILIIGGDGFLKEKLKKMAHELGVGEYIKFPGFIEDYKLPLYYQAADLFILPTKKLEGFGLVTLEALSSGLPVLGTPVGGTLEILGKLDKDLLFHDTSAQAMAEKILFYLSSKDLPGLSNLCREFTVSNYSWGKMADEYERVYRQCLA